jgi:PAS domain S-box-containing protein
MEHSEKRMKAVSAGGIRADGVASDITERRQAEEELRLMQFPLEHASDGVFWMNPQARIVYVNEAACRSLGRSREELLSLSIPDIDPLFPKEVWESFWAEVKVRGSMTFETQYQTKQGRVFPVEITANYLEFAGKEYSFAFARDITERKQAEEERQRSLEQLRALAGRLQIVREEERKRLAREIHDQLGQALTAIKIDLSSLLHDLPAGENQPSKRAASILQLVDESIRTVRRIATELRPGMLDDLGLVATIEWAGEDFQARTGTTCRLDLPPDDIAIDPERATAIFRIFQETLTNVARHAEASEVSVRLAKEDSDVTLEVHDDGKGIPEDKLANGESLGILGMRERAMLLGGEITISGPPGNGTTVKVRIPEAGRA